MFRAIVLLGHIFFGSLILLTNPAHAQDATEANLPGTYHERLANLDNPSLDGWNSEVLSENAKHQLADIVYLLKKPAAIDASALTSFLGAEFQTGRLRPTSLALVYASGGIQVFRAPVQDVQLKGAKGLAQALAELAAPFHTGSGIRVAVKLFDIAITGDIFSTRAYVETHASLIQGSLQQSAQWYCRWQMPEKGENPLLLSIRVQDFEECRLKQSQGTLFSEITEAVLGENASYSNQLLHGSNHWLTRIDNKVGSNFNGHHGLAVGDANGDGLDDVYVCQDGGLPNRLFLQNSDGSARDISKQAGVDWLETTRSALFLDLDNDGDQDLIINSTPSLLLMENQGNARYTLVRRLNYGASSYALAAIDYDGDTDLDLYVSTYQGGEDEGEAVPTPIPYHNANNGGRNHFLENRGNWTFVDITAEVGLDQNNSRFSFAATWQDYDNDGDPDLYVANDFGHNNLYRNDGGYFHDVAKQAGLTDGSFGMGITWADVNRDGLMDVHLSNMFSAAGSRVTRQGRFKPNESAASKARYQKLARGNSLFLNDDGGQFREISEEAAITMGRWSWGAKFADLNNDGWEDLVVANGYITGKSTNDL